jgi:hypothetical protein
VKLSRLGVAADGRAWRTAFEGAAMADLLDSTESVDQSRLFLIRLRRCMPTVWAVELGDSNYCNRAERC